jgi:hypothetical protein
VLCDTPDFIFPLKADIYYPIVEQGAYGNLNKQWVFDRTILCNFATAGTAWEEEVKPNMKINTELTLLGRTKDDIRISSKENKEAMVNIVIANIRTADNTLVYLETSGPRSGKSTLFELASNEPIVGPFGGVEHYKLVIRRSENQASDL